MILQKYYDSVSFHFLPSLHDDSGFLFNYSEFCTKENEPPSPGVQTWQPRETRGGPEVP